MATTEIEARRVSTDRRVDLDWLRILAVLLLVPFHTMLVFALDPIHVVYVKDTVQSDGLLAVAGFIHVWHMPLLFVVAGAATWFSLGRRGVGKYLRERVLRLLVPFAFGVLVLIPPMTYLHRLGQPNCPSFWQHYRGFFRLDFADLPGYQGTFTPSHLWFILFLFVFSVVALPVLRWLRSEGGARFTAALASALHRPGLLLLFGVPLALAAAVPLFGDKNPLYYLLFFLLGFLLMTAEGFQRAIERDWRLYLLSACLLTPLMYWTATLHAREWSPIWMADGLLYHGVRWTWVLAFLALGRRYLNIPTAILPYCSEGAYPFYLLHLPINTLVAFYVIHWPFGIPATFVSITLLTFLLTLAVYELLVKRVNILRFLFGMK